LGCQWIIVQQAVGVVAMTVVVAEEGGGRMLTEMKFRFRILPPLLSQLRHPIL
jgi:hypothetical protein